MYLSCFARLTSVIAIVLVATACSDRSPTAPSSMSTTGPPAQGTGAEGIAATGTVTTSSGPVPERSAANFEIKFLEGMIDHHAMAVEMARICVQKALHEELRQLCTTVISAQSAEITQMQSWLQSWYGVSYSPTMKPGDERMLERLSSLSGAEFEIMFMEMLIKHHEKAIHEARSCLDKAFHEELKTLCQNIIRTQSAEIQQLRTWLCQWYGECR